MKPVSGFENETITLKRFVCHKVVKAAKILAVHGNLLKLEGVPFEIEPTYNFMDAKRPEVGGYFVVYEDGYESYSPQKAFEEGYTESRPLGDEG